MSDASLVSAIQIAIDRNWDSERWDYKEEFSEQNIADIFGINISIIKEIRLKLKGATQTEIVDAHAENLNSYVINARDNIILLEQDIRNTRIHFELFILSIRKELDKLWQIEQDIINQPKIVLKYFIDGNAPSLNLLADAQDKINYFYDLLKRAIYKIQKGCDLFSVESRKIGLDIDQDLIEEVFEGKISDIESVIYCALQNGEILLSDIKSS